METIDDLVLEPVENMFDSVGLMQGSAAPAKRAAVGAGVGAAIVYGTKSNMFFDQNGNYRPWKLTATKTEEKDATWLPYWMMIGLPAFVFGVLI